MPTKQKRAVSTNLDMLPPDVVAAALAESAQVQAILRELHKRPLTTEATPESNSANAKIMKALRAGTAKSLLRRVRRKELLTKEELVERLGGQRRWVNNALKDGRLFTLEAPSGVQYFPAFFADDSYNRRTLCRIVHALDGVSEASKYWFFVTKFSSLQMCPLEAVAMGRTREVMACARSFAQV